LASGGGGAPAGGSRPGRRRRAAWLTAAAAALALALGLWWMGREGSRAAAVASAPPVADVPAPSAAPPPPPLPPQEELPEPIRRYLDATPYPSTSGRLTTAHEDLLHPNERYERPRPIPETLGGDPGAVAFTLFTADRYFYEGDQVVHAWLEARRGGDPLLLRVLRASARAEGDAGPLGSAVDLHFVAGPERLTTELPLTRFADHHGPILLEVLYEWAPGQTQEESLRIFHTPEARIPARFTDDFEDSFSNGSLRLGVGIEVESPGFYRVDANLYDAAGRPVAFAVFKGELDRSDRSVPLEVYGKVLRDADAPGPWRLRQVRGYRFLDGAYPDREIVPEHPGGWQTGEYALDSFLDAPHVSDHERHMVQLMLFDLARGIPVEFPALPEPGAPPPGSLPAPPEGGTAPPPLTPPASRPRG
jgi:hypothetical protein